VPALKGLLLVLTASVFLAGCGLKVPQPHEPYEATSNDTDFINIIFNNVKCELRRGYVKIKSAEGGTPMPRVDWIDGWGAKAELKFTTDEMGTVAPGVLFKPPLPFGLGIGVSASTHATRTEDSAVTYAFADLWTEAKNAALRDKKTAVDVGNCDNQNGVLIQSDLDIDNFLFKYVSLTTIPGTVLPHNQNVLFDTLTYTVTFVASYDANITPTWTLKRATVDGSAKLLDANRTKTSNLVITFSGATPAQAPAPGKAATPAAPASLSSEGQLAHLAASIGQSVATATQALTH
jgi:hypothetical protein